MDDRELHLLIEENKRLHGITNLSSHAHTPEGRVISMLANNGGIEAMLNSGEFELELFVDGTHIFKLYMSKENMRAFFEAISEEYNGPDYTHGLLWLKKRAGLYNDKAEAA